MASSTSGGARPAFRRRRRRLVVAVVAAVLVVGAVALFVLPDSSTGTAVPEGATVLEGEVVDGESGAGLADAVVRIDHEAGPTEVRTDGEGRYHAVVDASRPVAITADAPAHQGVVAFGKLCPGARQELRLPLPPAGPDEAPPAPIVVPESC